MAPPTLYWHPNSAPCRGTWLVIKALGIEVDFKELNLAEKEQYTDAFLKINPMHCVPTLVDNDAKVVLWESRAISTYLVSSKCSASSLYPADPVKRAIVDQRLYFDATFLHMRLRAITRPIIYEGVKEISEQKWKDLHEAFRFLDMFLEDKKYLASDTLTVADLHVLAMVATANHLDARLEDYPNLDEWYQICRGVVKGFEEHEEMVIKYTNMIKSKLDPVEQNLLKKSKHGKFNSLMNDCQKV